MYIEIPILLVFFCFMLEDAVTTNFILYRTCYVLLGYNETDCALLGSSNASAEIVALEKSVQPTATIILMTHRMVGNIIPILCSFIVGPWSNKHGRKPILISTFTGYCVSYIILTILSFLTKLSPWWWLLSCISLTLGGGLCSMLTVSFCYISDVTSESDRDIRMGIFEASISIGVLIGSISSSYVFAAVGYVGIYSICGAITLLAVIYTYFFVPESIREIEQENVFKDLFDISVIVKTFKTCFKPRQNKDRLILILLILILVIYVFVVFADISVFFVYIREKFHWSLRKYTLFYSVVNFLGIYGMFFALYVLNKFLGIKDLIIVTFVCLTYSCSSVITGLATQDWHIYLSAILKCLGGVMGPLVRAAISKLIPPDELGNIFSLTTSLESMTQLVSSPLYTYIYNTTLNTRPNTFNFLSAAIYAVTVIISSTTLVVQKLYPALDITHIE